MVSKITVTSSSQTKFTIEEISPSPKEESVGFFADSSMSSSFSSNSSLSPKGSSGQDSESPSCSSPSTLSSIPFEKEQRYPSGPSPSPLGLGVDNHYSFSKEDELPDWSLPQNTTEEDAVESSNKLSVEQQQDVALQRRKAVLSRNSALKDLSLTDLDAFNSVIGCDQVDGLTIESLSLSHLGQFLLQQGYTLEKHLATKGSGSYAFLIRNRWGSSQFLKVSKIKMWNYPTVKQFIYSDKRGAPCLLGKEGIKDVLAPIHVISYDKEQGLIFGGNDNNLICAEIYEYIPEALDLEEYSAKGNLGNAYVVRRCFDKILRAVSSFKALQIFHRDLNPQNILIPSRNPEDIVVIDFNCAVQEQNLCRSVEGIYSCPHNEKSRKIDEFSLGLLLLQMCTGLSPDSIFEDKTIRDRVLEGDIPLSLDISEDLRELIIALLQTDPKQRVDVEGAIKMLGFKPLTLETFSEFG